MRSVFDSACDCIRARDFNFCEARVELVIRIFESLVRRVMFLLCMGELSPPKRYYHTIESLKAGRIRLPSLRRPAQRILSLPFAPLCE